MQTQFSRTEMLLGKQAIEKLSNSKVAVFGIGGVGGNTVEALARSGVGYLGLFDDDKICLTNLNRQLIATRKTLGDYKVKVMKERILDINPNAQVDTFLCFYAKENAEEYDLSSYDYIVDAIDTVSSKLLLIERAYANKIPIISCMGAGNKLDPTQFEVADIYETSVCPLAKVIRRELKERKIPSLKVVYSKEPPLKPIGTEENNFLSPTDSNKNNTHRRQVPGSVAFVPAVAGAVLAGEVIKDIVALSK